MNGMTSDRPADKLKHEALDALAEQFPSSTVADLLTHFDKDTVLKLMVLYGGSVVRLPQVKTIWTSYRNKIIVETLDTRNDKVTRAQLAEYFGISNIDVSTVYSKAKQTKKYLSNAQVKRIVETIYRKNVEKFHKEMKALFSNKYGVEYFSVHDDLQNPEDQYLIREAVDKLIERCRKDVKSHPVFIAREYKIDYALKLIMEKIEDNH
jgi:hypothetical protein